MTFALKRTAMNTSSRQRTVPDPTERQAIARLSFALSHVLRLFRLASASGTEATAAIGPLEERLARAQLPEDYTEVARAIVELRGTSAAGSGAGVQSTFSRVAGLLADLARACGMPQLAAEAQAQASVVRDPPIDFDPLFGLGRRIVASVLVQQSTNEVLDECLKNVDGGIRRLAQDEVAVGHRVAEVRGRIARSEAHDLTILRGELLAAAGTLEQLVESRRGALIELQRTSRMAQRRTGRLLAALADATSAALTDPLTGLGNRRALQEAVGRVSSSASATGILALDLDHFKSINDTHGHSGGDRVLIRVAEILREELRPDDQAFRIGGEEILVLLARCDRAGAYSTAERIRERIARTSIPLHDGRRIQVSTSIGAALWEAGESFEASSDRADEALYQAKVGGRNRTVPA